MAATIRTDLQMYIKRLCELGWKPLVLAKNVRRYSKARKHSTWVCYLDPDITDDQDTSSIRFFRYDGLKEGD